MKRDARPEWRAPARSGRGEDPGRPAWVRRARGMELAAAPTLASAPAANSLSPASARDRTRERDLFRTPGIARMRRGTRRGEMRAHDARQVLGDATRPHAQH